MNKGRVIPSLTQDQVEQLRRVLGLRFVGAGRVAVAQNGNTVTITGLGGAGGGGASGGGVSLGIVQGAPAQETSGEWYYQFKLTDNNGLATGDTLRAYCVFLGEGTPTAVTDWFPRPAANALIRVQQQPYRFGVAPTKRVVWVVFDAFVLLGDC